MEMIVRGARIKIFPSKEQAAMLDEWRLRCISLWNLLLGMERAAYSGEPFRPELGWRKIWRDITLEHYQKEVKEWEEGKTVVRGRNKGEVIPPRSGPAPTPPEKLYLRKIRGGRVDGAVPALFIWKADLQKIMARLKKVPLTKWIGGIQSHAAQAVCRDIDVALNAMLRERKKGAGGRNAGFPRPKRQRYAAGSVHFVNTQLKSRPEDKRIKLPNGVGDVRYSPVNAIPHNATLSEGRAWREGDQWWLSVIYKRPAKAPLPPSDRTCGVKVAASALYTVYDVERDSFTQIMAPGNTFTPGI